MNNFSNFEHFTSYIISSNQINLPYFMFISSVEILSIPKFQSLVESKSNELPIQTPVSRTIPPTPIARPLQVLYQRAFWDDLIQIYFKEFHIICPVFSIKSFDPRTASKFLLSAVYFAGFRLKQDQPNELVNYMNIYARYNIKNAIKSTSVANIQALILFSYFLDRSFDFNLFTVCKSHATRMGYQLGLHIDNKKLSLIDRYDRKLLFAKIRSMNIGLSRFESCIPNYITEFGEFSLKSFDSELQLPDKDTIFNSYTKEEKHVYSICSTEATKLNDKCMYLIWHTSFNSIEKKVFKSKWTSIVRDIGEYFANCIEKFNQLLIEYTQYKSEISMFEYHMRNSYHEIMLEMYGILNREQKGLTPQETFQYLNHCQELLNSILNYPKFDPFSSFFTYLIGYNYLNIYPKCDEIQKQAILTNLNLIINLNSENFTLSNSTNYLILKTGLKLILS
ncbi:hypothetical protein CONCODRAFT_17832 [Conidiobolus coronatus NRRL 28638]|uniref:Xylanolytic transcriptional activator regulatory domain-containing protein n=1 Tax=Conidiobolus coronatus (strain ATCC 28846 / CBS 209.66 / NRRL 28638) TaxID=796925 RepID=A0A137P5E6_CONC2|nr:hypothetical protein CONCODRAFT_17832 [Conidiobolus coronatus NRRL 28638]|eukprot:KXN70154.1 hypothetical protein CONCODRAFT_17832 [Conidiobolus coronatus NRRL 28638]